MMTFAQALDEHLAAIAARDIERFAATVSRSPDARVIGPDGTAIVGGDAIVAAHRGWFESEKAWTFTPRVVLERAGDTLAFALLDVDYHEGGTQRRFSLCVVFARDDGSGKLFYDQNTTQASAQNR